jgi:hypothetical protein
MAIGHPEPTNDAQPARPMVQERGTETKSIIADCKEWEPVGPGANGD